MTSTLPRSVNIGAIAAAFAYTSLTFGAAIAPTAAEARSNSTFYTVELAQPVSERTTTIAGGVAWNCKGTTCVAQKGNSRPLRVCRELQREHGEIAAFTAKDEALDAEKLAKCNG
ncbi:MULTISPECIES: hypothetical protein [unclassified Erythrobacter]|jgi:hypothetical protein|uniref:CC_3452 family protein n=1 Tax=Erythrobacteraceae TaxID=335929 RepID=UPI00076C3DF7|nr:MULTISPECIES: hypothetical protein [unclassified Erythrobacter]KWV93692.1 hypothetical protein ASS64_12385 [Erythrobacter sp. AP23]MBO6526524.1 hypothetical protein [Erythrobacter sp.]MBO6529264.1 hypothetical protein [Erythrobacter sp.]MBO6767531.1 hypothetical protein [Erythrobacter sp.]